MAEFHVPQALYAEAVLKLAEKSFCLCSIQFSIHISNIFLSSSASLGVISPYISTNLQQILFWLNCWWCGKSSLFPEVLESLVDVAQLLADHVVGVDQTFLSWNLEEFSCFLSDMNFVYWYLIIYVSNTPHHSHSNETLCVLQIVDAWQELTETTFRFTI